MRRSGISLLRGNAWQHRNGGDDRNGILSSSSIIAIYLCAKLGRTNPLDNNGSFLASPSVAKGSFSCSANNEILRIKWKNWHKSTRAKSLVADPLLLAIAPKRPNKIIRKQLRGADKQREQSDEKNLGSQIDDVCLGWGGRCGWQINRIKWIRKNAQWIYSKRGRRLPRPASTRGQQLLKHSSKILFAAGRISR